MDEDRKRPGISAGRQILDEEGAPKAHPGDRLYAARHTVIDKQQNHDAQQPVILCGKNPQLDDMNIGAIGYKSTQQKI